MPTRERAGPLRASNPFWEFSLRLWRRPGVASACVRLQDRLGIDVNLLLYGCWSAACGAPELRRRAWLRLHALTRSWQSGVVAPLRGVRQRLDRGFESLPADSVDALRRRVAAIELAAERCEQSILYRHAVRLHGRGRKAATRATRPERRAVARANLIAYLAAQARAPSKTDWRRAEVILDACFPRPGARIPERRR